MLRSRLAHRDLNILVFLCGVAFATIATAQESPTPTPSPVHEESAPGSISPEQSVVGSPTPEPTASTLPLKSIRISFVPPPMEGTISLGVYDQTGKLVRVLYRNAQLDDFTIGADALTARWDGKDDKHQDLPPGRYHARGYMVGPLKREDLGEASPNATEAGADTVKVRLVRNPLRKNRKQNVELAVGFNPEGNYLQTSSGLPLFKISDTPNVTRGGITLKGDNVVDVWQDEGNHVHQFRISNVDQMMAFDCGEVEVR
jgi:hypothetical protein